MSSAGLPASSQPCTVHGLNAARTQIGGTIVRDARLWTKVSLRTHHRASTTTIKEQLK
ncbi:hypothetical protein [Nocardioides sp.]|uniref:hypothetical protein n=1 Tax=Nocardioides sp. TaxID=35761 RepID=UPI003D136A34